MSNVNDVPASLTKTLANSDLREVTTSIAESIIDSTMNDGILKEVPILGTLVGLSKTVGKIKEALFIKKVVYFINEVKDVPPEQREKIVREIDMSEKYRLKLGEKLMYILDKADDHEKSQLIGRLFKSFLLEEIDYDTFLRCSVVIDRSIMEDLYYFIDADWEQLSIEEAGDYINWRLFEIEPMRIEISQNYKPSGYDDEVPQYAIKGADMNAKITFVGKTLRRVLKTKGSCCGI